MTGLVPFYRKDVLTNLGEVNDLFDQFFNSSSVPAVNRGLRCDIIEQEKMVVIEVDLPGVKKENIDIQLDDGYLAIAVKTVENEDADNSGTYIVKERRYDGCQRSFNVGKRVTKEDIKAKVEDGVLTLTIDKRGDEPKDTKVNIS